MKVVTFGELLLRLAAPGYSKLFQKDSLDVTFCGAEANVAVSLSIFGAESVFVTKLPDSDVGRAAARSLDYFKVDTSKIVYGAGRMGAYFLEKGVSQRPSKVIYDRAYSAFALARPEEFDWDDILEGADWFHWTGINPALSDEMSEICLEASRKAKEKRIAVSCDLNYRAKLWSPEKARSVMKKLIPYADACFCNEEDAEKVLGIKNESTDSTSGMLDETGLSRVAKTICDAYGCKYVATSIRKSYSASRNGWSATLYDADVGESYFSRKYDIQLADRVGGGDAFSAGLVYAFGTRMNCRDAIEFAAAASCLKQTIEGDFNRTTLEDVEFLLKSGGNGRIQR